jgi:cAMP-dependent protein kinase regulator
MCLCVSQLAESFLFDGLQAEGLATVVDAMRRESVEAGTRAIHQGDAGDLFYVVNSGELRVLVDGKVVSTLGPRAHFGELALMFNCPRYGLPGRHTCSTVALTFTLSRAR